MHQYKSRGNHLKEKKKKKKKPTTHTTHWAPQAWCPQLVCWKPSSLRVQYWVSVSPGVCQWAAAVPVSVRHNKLSVLTGSGWPGWVASGAPHHLPSCRHPVKCILGGLNRGAHHSAHGCGLTGWAREWAAITLQDTCALPVVHVVSCRETGEIKSVLTLLGTSHFLYSFYTSYFKMLASCALLTPHTILRFPPIKFNLSFISPQNIFPEAMWNVRVLLGKLQAHSDFFLSPDNSCCLLGLPWTHAACNHAPRFVFQEQRC